MVTQPFENDGIVVENGHIRMDADGHLCRVEANNTSADDNDFAWENARHAAEKHAPPPVGFFERGGAGLDREAPGDLAHRLQQREPAPFVAQSPSGDFMKDYRVFGA